MGSESGGRRAPALDGFLLDLYRADTLELVAEHVVHACRAIEGVEAVVVLKGGDSHLVPYRWHGVEDEALGQRIRRDGPVAARLASGAPMHIADLRGDVIRALGGRRAVPAMGRSELQAVLVIDAPDKQGDLWSFVEQIAPHVGLAMEDRARIQMLTTPSTDGPADDHVRWVQLFGRPGTVRQMAGRVARVFGEALQAPRVAVYRYDPLTSQLLRVATRGVLAPGETPDVLDGQGLPRVLSASEGEEGPLQGVARGGELRNGDDVEAGSWAQGTASSRVVIVPLMSGDAVVAVLALAGADMFPPLEEIASQTAEMRESAGVALERAMLLEPMLFDSEFPILDGRFVEALLCDASRRADHQGTPIMVVSMRLGESSTHRSEEPARPVPIDALVDGLLPVVEAQTEAFGHLDHGRFVGILRGSHAQNALGTVQGWADHVAYLRGSVSVHAFAIVERHPSERWDSVWQRAHQLCAQLYDEGPGLRLGMSGALGDEVVREGVPDWVTPNPIDPR